MERTPIRTFEDLECWKACRELRLFVAREVVRSLPKEERFRRGDQLLRAARSTTANIAEGYGRESPGSYVSFLRTAQGSLKELETHILLAERLGIVADTAKCLDQCASVGKLLRALMRSIPSEK